MATEHLTAPDPQLAKFQAQTPPGMAFWSGTGPTGTTCRECRFWKEDGLDAEGDLKDAKCAQYERMMRAAMILEAQGLYLPGATASCKYFVENPSPPKPVSTTEVPGGWAFDNGCGGLSEPFKTRRGAVQAARLRGFA